MISSPFLDGTTGTNWRPSRRLSEPFHVCFIFVSLREVNAPFCGAAVRGGTKIAARPIFARMWKFLRWHWNTYYAGHTEDITASATFSDCPEWDSLLQYEEIAPQSFKALSLMLHVQARSVLYAYTPVRT